MEVLVVIAILGLLAGLLIHAIQVAREAARRVECVSHLRQIGIALNAYHAVQDMFTPGHMLTKNNWSSNRLSGFVFLLPHLDQQVLYDAINMSFSQSDAPDKPNEENGTVSFSRLAVYLCPSDGEPKHRSSYRFNYGGQATGPGYLGPGPFLIGVLPRAASITDGLSRTAFVSERIGGSFDRSRRTVPRDVKYVPWVTMFVPQDEIYIDYCVSADGGAWNPRAGEFWMFNGMEHTDYNHNGSPNDPRPTCGYTDFGLHPPRSFHPGLVNVLLGDGHVEAVLNSIERKVWRSMGTSSQND